MHLFPRARWRPLFAAVARRWRLALVVAWIGIAAWLVWQRFDNIRFFVLGDTDDNLRMAQVRAWLGGQGWFDLRQYRLSPPRGFDIHWSRLVDLPIAGLILLLRPFVGELQAVRWAAGLAPLLPLGAILWATALSVRRLVAPGAFWLAPVALLSASYVLNQVVPMRIDHHGWQLAMLATMIAGIADPRRQRGAATAAAAIVLSLVIGLELLPYLALGVAAFGLRWVVEGNEAAADALRTHAALLAAGSALGYVLFASIANRAPVCDALSPVWLSATIGGGALLWALGLTRPRSAWARLALAAGAGAVLAAVWAWTWPDCLGRPERVSPELDRLWLSNVREARPIWKVDGIQMAQMLTLPLLGLAGAIGAAWRARRTPRLMPWLVAVLLALVSIGLICWQVRATPAAQLIALPGAVALGWGVLHLFRRLRNPFVKLGIVAALVLLLSGGALSAVLGWIPSKPQTARMKQVNLANWRCPRLTSLRPVARMPQATIFTFVDYGPRLIATTHHSAIAGPYHRNGEAILAVHHAFDGSPERARRIMKSRGATLLLVCPNMSESTIYRSRSPRGFYARLARGERFDWLEPVPLPRGSPLRLWRIS